jgi:hypothetical protein
METENKEGFAMDNLIGLGAALAAMSTDDERRYDGCVMLSALPDAPIIDRPTLIDRIRRLRPGGSQIRASAPASPPTAVHPCMERRAVFEACSN